MVCSHHSSVVGLLPRAFLHVYECTGRARLFLTYRDADPEDTTNLLVARLVRTCRMFRIIRGSARFEAAKVMIFVLLKTVVNTKWVFLVVTGFVACVCTLGLNWFGYVPPRSLAAVCNYPHPHSDGGRGEGRRCATSVRGSMVSWTVRVPLFP